jgi:predicted TIM-barrel fold metal-dependent hydrolase
MVDLAVKDQDAAASSLFAGLKIVDCDSHLTEPSELWSSRAPASWLDRMPQQRTVDGVTSWYVDGALWASTGGNTIRKGREKVKGSHVLNPFEEIDPAAWNVKDRLGLMDEMGLYAQITYPNGIGFASNHIFAIEDVAQRTLILQVLNDFYADAQEESGGRLLPQAMLPIWDMDLTVKEMERLIDRDIRGFTLSDRPELLGLPELDDEYYTPMWDLFDNSGSVVNFHIGSGKRREEIEAGRTGRYVPTPGQVPAVASPTWSSFGRYRQLVAHSVQSHMSNVRIVVNLCLSDLFDRFPHLKIVSVESGIGWIPFMLETMEFSFDEMVTSNEELKLQKRRPSEYFHDHIFCTFWYESHAPKASIPLIGVKNVLIESDIPHPVCLYPGLLDHLAEVLGHLDEWSIRRIMQDNAAELYNISLD